MRKVRDGRFVGQAERAQHIGRLDRGRGTGRAGGDAQVRHARHQVGGGGGGEGHVQVAGDPRRHAAVHRDAGNRRAQPVQQAVAQSGQPLRLLRHFGLRQAAGLAQADDQRRRQRAGAQPALLAAAGEQRRQPHARPAADKQRADALRSVELVAADRGQIDLPAGQVERDLARPPARCRCGTARPPAWRSRRARRCPAPRRSRCSPP